jgi:hypothetical protein
MNKCEVQEFTHVLYVDRFSTADEIGNVTFSRQGLYKPKNIVYTGLVTLFTLCITLPWVMIMVTSWQSLPSKFGLVTPFYDIDWWLFILGVFCCCCWTLCMVLRSLQLILLAFYTQFYNISIDFICVQKRHFLLREQKILNLIKMSGLKFVMTWTININMHPFIRHRITMLYNLMVRNSAFIFLETINCGM